MESAGIDAIDQKTGATIGIVAPGGCVAAQVTCEGTDQVISMIGNPMINRPPIRTMY
jgi:hypothetical protein